MVLNQPVTIALFFLASILIAIGLYVVVRRLTKVTPRNSLRVCIILGLFIGGIGWNFLTCPVIEIGSRHYSLKVIIGSVQYTAADGMIYELDADYKGCYVVNISDSNLIRERMDFPQIVLDTIPPHLRMMSMFPPTHYPWENPEFIDDKTVWYHY